MNRYDGRHEQMNRRVWLWAVRGCLLIVILLSPIVTVIASGQSGDMGQAPSAKPTALVLAPLAASDDLLSVVERLQRSGFTIYEHLGNQSGEFLLAGVALSAGEAMPDVDIPLQLLAPDITHGIYYWVLPPRGQSQLDWNKFGALLYDDGDQALIRMTAGQAERLAQQGAEIGLLTFQPLVIPSRAPTVEYAPLEYEASIQGIIDQVTSQKVHDYTAQLSGVVPVVVGGSSYTIATRHTASGTPIQKATQYVGEFMTGLGYTVTTHPWSSGGYSGINVVGERLGLTRPSEIYIIGAHLDDMPALNPPTVVVAPGADDNASGSVATMLAAEIFSHYDWDVTLRFAFWTGEEQGLRGSSAYATQAFNQGQNIRGYLNLDMLAYNGGAPNEINLFWKSTVPASESLVDLFVDSVTTYGLNLAPFKYNTVNYTVGNQSDNKPFWDRGYAAMLAIEDYYGDFNPRYHTVNDTLAYADMPYYTDLVKASLATFARMAGGPLSDPMAVSLASFSAAPAAGGVEVTWETVSEIDNLGFNLYRGLTPEQPDELLAFVPSQAPGSAQGATYLWLDSGAGEGRTVFYWLEDVDVDGSASLHGPVSVDLAAPTAMTVTGITAGDGSDAPGMLVLSIVVAALLAAGYRTALNPPQIATRSANSA